jgi:hypothetical protein
MKTFKDLKFEPHKVLSVGAKQAVLLFPNGYGASVVTGSSFFYTSPSHPYELAVLDKDYNLVYDTPITNDVIGHCTEENITQLLKDIQELPPREKKN